MHSDVVGVVEDGGNGDCVRVGGVREAIDNVGVSVDSVGTGVHSDPLHLMVEGNYVFNQLYLIVHFHHHI